jgi:methyl-accepting chemotaxis protein
MQEIQILEKNINNFFFDILFLGFILQILEKVEAGHKLVKDTQIAVNEIVASVQKVAEVIKEISLASNEQSIGVEQVNQAIN